MPLQPALLEQAAARLRAAQRVVVFTGAGVSAESGIPTFRDADGFWQRFPPERFAYWEGLIRTALRRPGELAEFLHAVLEPIATATPNAAHRAIARLAVHVPVKVITQNVDRLHQDAGSREVREVHGSFFEIVDRKRRILRELSRADLATICERLERARQGSLRLPRLLAAIRPLCGLALRGIYKPRLVLFGMQLAEPDWTQAQADTAQADVVLIVGTSGLIFPAANLPNIARRGGASIIHIDPLDPGPPDLWLEGRAGAILPKLVELAFGKE